MLKNKILNGEKLIGSHVNLSDITVSKLVGKAGFDYIWLDMEHSYLSYETMLHHIMTVQNTGTAAVVRVPQGDLTATKKILEMGPDGIIFPMIRTVEEARRLISFTLYPPYGDRGFGPGNAVDYGYKDALQYASEHHETMCRFIQIEHREAIGILDELLEIPYIDGYIFGPMDLSGSYHMLGDICSKKMTAVMKNAVEKIHGAGRYAGVSVGGAAVDFLQYWHDLGIDMISAGVDYDYIRNGALEAKKNLSQLWK